MYINVSMIYSVLIWEKLLLYEIIIRYKNIGIESKMHTINLFVTIFLLCVKQI